MQQSQVYAAAHLGMRSGQIPYRTAAQPNDPFASDDLLAVSRQRCHWFGFGSQFGFEPHSVEDLGGQHRSSIQLITGLREVRSILVRNGFVLRTRDPAGPLHSDALGTTSACFHCLSELHRENLGEYPIVQALLDGAVSGAWTTDSIPVHPGALDGSLVAQRVQMEAHGGDVQPDVRGEFDSVNRVAVRTHQLKHSFALPVARQAISLAAPGLGVCFVAHQNPYSSYI